MQVSPCKKCLIFPCCTVLCDEKIYFTSERIIRMSKFFNLDINKAVEDKTISKCLSYIWKENASIARRSTDSVPENLIESFKKIKEKIEQEILLEGPGKNKSFCNKLIKQSVKGKL